MSRVVLTWELGSNLGHLSRLLPLAVRLKSRGHSPLLVARDLTLAAKVFAEAGIPYIQAPVPTSWPSAAQPPMSYAEVLWNQGWADQTQLWGLVQGWANLFRMFRPDVAVLDHSPTALLATRVTSTPAVLIGTGFEIPPTGDPIPGFANGEASHGRVAESERRALANANWALGALKVRPLASLRQLFDADLRYLTTYPELDHYGPRTNERYVGPIGELGGGERHTWPPARHPRIFAYLRPGIATNQPILRALKATNAAVICFLPGATADIIDSFASDHFQIASRPIQLTGLFNDVDLCVSYAPAGTVTAALLKGVPHLMTPQHPEAQLTALRVEAMGAGLTVSDAPAESEINRLVLRLLSESSFKSNAAAFAAKYPGFDAAQAADLIVDEIDQLRSHSSKPVDRNSASAVA